VERDLKKAIDQFLRASERGSAGADERIGWFFHKGYVMARSDADALVWFRRAASHNHKLGEYDMGLCYEYGWGVERNLKEAANWYERSFHHGYRKAGEALRRISRQ
jgi:TPR repeat protein